MGNTDFLDLDESPGFPYKIDDNIIQIKTRTYFLIEYLR